MSGFRIAANNQSFVPPKKGYNDWTNRLFDERPSAVAVECRNCGRSMYVPPSKVYDRAHCSRACIEEAASKLVPVLDWAGRIFEPRPGVIQKDCANCGLTMNLPPSKAPRMFCAAECKRALTQRRLSEASRPCQTCGKLITPRNNGVRSSQRKFCSQKCNDSGKRIMENPIHREKAISGRAKALAEGRVKILKGELNPNWNGGHEAYIQRQKDSGYDREYTRKYRKANPHKVREFSQTRSNRKRVTPRLPRGTVQSIMKMQNGKCAICRVKVGGKYHLDHIVPLALNGLHEPKNLQILCAPCNAKKGAKDPLEYMQSLGRLL